MLRAGSNLWLVNWKILMLHLCWNRTVFVSFTVPPPSKWLAILLSKGILARYLRTRSAHTSPHKSVVRKNSVLGTI